MNENTAVSPTTFGMFLGTLNLTRKMAQKDCILVSFYHKNQFRILMSCKLLQEQQGSFNACLLNNFIKFEDFILKIRYFKRFFTFLHKKMFFRKSIFENFNISKNKIISFEGANVLGQSLISGMCGGMGAWGHLGELAWMPTIQKNIFPIDGGLGEEISLMFPNLV